MATKDDAINLEEQFVDTVEEGVVGEVVSSNETIAISNSKALDYDSINAEAESPATTDLKPVDLEDGEVVGVDEKTGIKSMPICRFYMRNACTWGSLCRFQHPGDTVQDGNNHTSDRTPIAQPIYNYAGNVQAYDVAYGWTPYDVLNTSWDRNLRTVKQLLYRNGAPMPVTDMACYMHPSLQTMPRYERGHYQPGTQPQPETLNPSNSQFPMHDLDRDPYYSQSWASPPRQCERAPLLPTPIFPPQPQMRYAPPLRSPVAYGRSNRLPFVPRAINVERRMWTSQPAWISPVRCPYRPRISRSPSSKRSSSPVSRRSDRRRRRHRQQNREETPNTPSHAFNRSPTCSSKSSATTSCSKQPSNPTGRRFGLRHYRQHQRRKLGKAGLLDRSESPRPKTSPLTSRERKRSPSCSTKSSETTVCNRKASSPVGRRFGLRHYRQHQRRKLGKADLLKSAESSKPETPTPQERRRSPSCSYKNSDATACNNKPSSPLGRRFGLRHYRQHQRRKLGKASLLKSAESSKPETPTSQERRRSPSCSNKSSDATVCNNKPSSAAGRRFNLRRYRQHQRRKLGKAGLLKTADSSTKNSPPNKRKRSPSEPLLRVRGPRTPSYSPPSDNESSQDRGRSCSAKTIRRQFRSRSSTSINSSGCRAGCSPRKPWKTLSLSSGSEKRCSKKSPDVAISDNILPDSSKPESEIQKRKARQEYLLMKLLFVEEEIKKKKQNMKREQKPAKPE
ncbi:serine/arginine repetitive matrix protein 1 [Scaptodrosophila lebanonensis]|uniref:Serine/arginine repetitive matrix protein 1 n=1 Tax=Drosophila lebanonensis TaxID=7225 RepID=A0A6J2TNQ9_DROLE|nr:serine/arginine repetitive matrix protein 1 [Scaptodrosophila lebanonensis]